MRALCKPARRGPLWVAAGLLVVGGCLFEPRESEQGGTVFCFQPIPAYQDAGAFVNVEGSLRCKLADTYLKQFAPEFLFIPAPSVAAANPAAFADPWTIDDETNFAGRLAATADSIIANLDLHVDESTRNGSDPVSYVADYVVRYVPFVGPPSVYRGKAEYTLRKLGGTFVISGWEEREPAQGDLAFGQLRGELYQ